MPAILALIPRHGHTRRIQTRASRALPLIANRSVASTTSSRHMRFGIFAPAIPRRKPRNRQSGTLRKRPAARGLFVSQRVDGVDAGGFDGGIEAKNDPNDCRHATSSSYSKPWSKYAR